MVHHRHHNDQSVCVPVTHIPYDIVVRGDNTPTWVTDIPTSELFWDWDGIVGARREMGDQLKNQCEAAGMISKPT